MAETNRQPLFFKTPQQDLQRLLSREQGFDADLQHALDRSCTPHCIEVIAELHKLHLSSLEQLDKYIAFLREHGAHPTNGTNNPNLYGVDDGWYNIAIADLLRESGFEVISQGLAYSSEVTDLVAAAHAGRARSDRELADLEKLARHGGPDKAHWLDALADTLAHADWGHVIVSVTIPSSVHVGEIGRHSVLALSIDDECVEYFDPDNLATERYGQGAAQQMITRIDSDNLVYRQPREKFLARMTGEVMHIFPPTSLV